MSSGPIQRERDAWKPPVVSTSDAARVCKASRKKGRGYCGRKATGAKVAAEWVDVECSDCEAAYRADEAVAA